MSFLTARWERLLVANYSVDPEVLQPFVPAGTDLDIFDGKCYVSLVGFMFKNTKVFGMKLPGHVNFEEVNLRFYVKRQEGDVVKRGVVFIREIVPKRIITFVANTVYKENYRTYKMAHQWFDHANEMDVEYRWKKNGMNWQVFNALAAREPREIKDNSLEEFILEHYWGYAQVNEAESVEYEVRHPKWRSFDVKEYQIEVDFEKVYGPEFASLNHREPDSVLLAEGSPISVEKQQKLKIQ